MAQVTEIGWTDLTWNPTHGCSKVSPGCANCYAETLSRRYKLTAKPWTPENAAGNVLLKPHKLREPLSNAKAWQGLGAAAAGAGMTRGQLVFVDSMSDLFHELVPASYIADVFAVMAAAEQHTFQILTKRPERMRDLLRSDDFLTMLETGREDQDGYPLPDVPWPLPNVWLGVSIENRRFVSRADVLRETPAAVRFISAEPLLGPLIYDSATASSAPSPRPALAAVGLPAAYRCWADGANLPELALTGIDWLIAGGESGPGRRPVRAEWVQALRDACLATAIGDAPHDCRFFFKQWGGSTPKAGGRQLDGRTWDEFPLALERAT